MSRSGHGFLVVGPGKLDVAATADRSSGWSGFGTQGCFFGPSIMSMGFDGINSSRAETLAVIRKARGLTQQQLSAELGISQAEVSRIEHRTNVHIETLARFIAATGGQLRISAVYEDTEYPIGLPTLTETAE